jgi:hypothetical protein
MMEPARKNMRFRFFYRYDDGREVDVDLEFRLNKEAEAWARNEFNGLTYLRHERVAEKH